MSEGLFFFCIFALVKLAIMKKVFALLLALLAVLMLTACNKNEPQNRLIGTWEVSVKTTLKATLGETTGEKTYDEGVWYYTFYKEGSGRMVKVDDVDNSSTFTYMYHKEDNTIDYVSNEKSFVWEIDVLTNDTFFFHTSSTSVSSILGLPVSSSSQSTFSGKKVK